MKELPRRITRNHHLIILYTFIALSVVSNIILGSYIKTLWDLGTNDFSVVRSYIIDAINNLYQPTEVEPQEKKQYIIDARLRFPITTSADRLFYGTFLQDVDNKTVQHIELTTDRTLSVNYAKLSHDKTLFDAVPEVQRCTKSFIIQFEDAEIQVGFEKLHQTQLEDGRTAYIYENVDRSCNSYTNNETEATALQQVILQVESY